MGEVYRARDSRLGRDVALKILPAHFTADSERRARFAREARTLATLNHPHIGAILESDGAPAREKTRWSEDGRLLYYVSSRGGLWNVWAVEFASREGVFGKPFQVTSFNGPGEQLPDSVQFEIAVGGGRLVMPTLRPTGGIWLLAPPQGDSAR